MVTVRLGPLAPAQATQNLADRETSGEWFGAS